MDALMDWGIALIQLFQRMSPALDDVMEFITFFGLVEFYMIFIPLLYWVVNRRWGFKAFLVLLFTDFVGTSIKLFGHQPRPYWVSNKPRLIGSEEHFYGFVSTHSSNPPAVLGYLALQIKKQWMWVVTITAAFLIGFSRMYLGVHFPQDVVGGWAVGALMLYLIAKAEPRIGSWMSKNSTSYQILTGFVVSIVFIVISYLIKQAISGSPDSETWANYSTMARSLDHFVTLGGATFGAISGYALMLKSARFSVAGTVVQKATRYLLGMVGLIAILYGLDFAFDAIQGSEMVGFVLRYIRYGLTTFWAMFGAPWVFLKLNLAKPEA